MEGTVGAKARQSSSQPKTLITEACLPQVLGGATKLDIDGTMIDIKLGVERVSFSAHADAKGKLQYNKTIHRHKNIHAHHQHSHARRNHAADPIR